MKKFDQVPMVFSTKHFTGYLQTTEQLNKTYWAICKGTSNEEVCKGVCATYNFARNQLTMLLAALNSAAQTGPDNTERHIINSLNWCTHPCKMCEV